MQKLSDNEAPAHSSSSSNSRILNLKKFFRKFFKKNNQKDLDTSIEIDQTFHSVEAESNETITSKIKSFSNKTVEDVMIPRSYVVSISIDSSFNELCKAIIEHRHTRTLIFDKNLDNIVGFVHIKDLFELMANAQKFNLRKLLRKHIIATHTMNLVDLLAQMQYARTHIAVVIDEYGGTDGLITIEDIIEEIVGKIDDEHDTDTDEDIFKVIRPGLIVTSARVEIEEIESVIGVKLKDESDEIDTIGGLVMAISGNVPEKGVVIEIKNKILAEIIESTPRTIKKIKITYPIK